MLETALSMRFNGEKWWTSESQNGHRRERFSFVFDPIVVGFIIIVDDESQIVCPDAKRMP